MVDLPNSEPVARVLLSTLSRRDTPWRLEVLALALLPPCYDTRMDKHCPYLYIRKLHGSPYSSWLLCRGPQGNWPYSEVLNKSL